ncbi:transposase [Saccharicrinis fermentans]
MITSKIGELAQKYWFEIPEHFPFVKLDEFVVMPNHIHGIIEIAKTNDERGNVTGRDDDGRDAKFCVSTPSPQPPSPQPPSPSRLSSPSSPKNKFGPQSQNLASIIRGYKIGVTKLAKMIDYNWGWQPRYYDHIIRDDISYQRIKNYIKNNPKKWNEDKFHT